MQHTLGKDNKEWNWENKIKGRNKVCEKLGIRKNEHFGDVLIFYVTNFKLVI